MSVLTVNIPWNLTNLIFALFLLMAGVFFGLAIGSNYKDEWTEEKAKADFFEQEIDRLTFKEAGLEDSLKQALDNQPKRDPKGKFLKRGV